MLLFSFFIIILYYFIYLLFTFYTVTLYRENIIKRKISPLYFFYAIIVFVPFHDSYWKCFCPAEEDDILGPSGGHREVHGPGYT